MRSDEAKADWTTALLFTLIGTLSTCIIAVIIR